MNELTVVRHVFEGSELESVLLAGRPCWAAGQIGEACGYSRGSDFAHRILGEWRAEMAEGKDFAFLEGEDLRAFNQASLNTRNARVHQNAGRGLLVLFESGIHLALLRTRKPAGGRLRRFLADEVMPQLARTGRYESPDALTPSAHLADLDRRVGALEIAVTGIAQGVAGIAQGVQALLGQQVQRAELPGPSAHPQVTVHMPGAVIHISEPRPPSQYRIHGLTTLATLAGVGHKTMRKWLTDAEMWADPEVMWIGQATVPRGNRLSVENRYSFVSGILDELKRRQSPLFAELATA